MISMRTTTKGIQKFTIEEKLLLRTFFLFQVNEAQINPILKIRVLYGKGTTERGLR